MTYGSTEGTARLLVDGEDMGEAKYEISVSQERKLKEISGVIYADWRILRDAFNGKKVTLVLEDGEEINVAIPSWEQDRNFAEIYPAGS